MPSSTAGSLQSFRPAYSDDDPIIADGSTCSDSAWSLLKPPHRMQMRTVDAHQAPQLALLHEQVTMLKQALRAKENDVCRYAPTTTTSAHIPCPISLTARLARMEEAAKKLLTARDPTLRGAAAGKLLAAQQRVLHLEHENQRMQLQLARYQKQPLLCGLHDTRTRCRRQAREMSVYVQQKRGKRRGATMRGSTALDSQLTPRETDPTAGSTQCELLAQQAAEIEQQRALICQLQHAVQNAVPSLVPDSAEALALVVQQLAVRAKASHAASHALQALQHQHAVTLQVWIRGRERCCCCTAFVLYTAPAANNSGTAEAARRQPCAVLTGIAKKTNFDTPQHQSNVVTRQTT